MQKIKKSSHCYRMTAYVVTLTLLIGQIFIFPVGAQNVLDLPAPGSMIALSPGFTPVILKGIKVYPENPFQFDFIVDSGNTGLQGDSLRGQSQKIIKYFLASLTIPEGELWVNLSPHEKDRIITDNFGQTEMGRDLLAQDYILKQITASLLHPENELGERFWGKVYQKAQDLYGTAEIPINAFNRVWILPDRAEILQQNNTALVVDTHLKVMLEEDYLAYAQAAYGEENSIISDTDNISRNDVSSEFIRKVVLPELEKEVNEGKNFIILRQIYNSLILAAWYKKTLKQSVLTRAYADQKKIDGVNVADINITNKIYEQYLQAYKKGVFDFIKEDYDYTAQQIIPRKYFSGGIRWDGDVWGDKTIIASSPIELSQNGKDGLENIQREPNNLSFVSVLFKAVKSKWSAFFKPVKNNLKELISASVLTVALVSPLPSRAVTPNSLEFIKNDTKHYYDQAEYVNRITARNIDSNLDVMLEQYRKEQGDSLIPAYLTLPNLRAVIKRLGLDNVRSFEELVGALRREFSSQYSRHKAGRIKSRELAKLELEITQWVMDFLITTTEPDHVGVDQNDKKMAALYRLFIGKETAPDGQRVYVCSSLSQAAVILLVEFGVRREAVKMYKVIETHQWKTYPDINGIGHDILGISTSDGELFFFDQTNKPIPKEKLPNKVGTGETLEQLGSFFKKEKSDQVLKTIWADLQSIDDEAQNTFKRKQWQEAERLFALLARKANEQAEFSKAVFTGLVGDSDKRGNSLTAEDVDESIKEFARVAEINAITAGKNFKIQEREKQFEIYKKFENRYNDLLVEGREISSREAPALIKEMRGLKADIEVQLINRSLLEEIRVFYEHIMTSVNYIIEQLSGQNVQNPVRPQTDSKSSFGNPADQFNALVDELNILVGNRTISSDEGSLRRETLEGIKKKAISQMSSKGLPRSVKNAYNDLIDGIDESIRKMSKFMQQQNTTENQFQEYKALEDQFNQLVGNRTISSREFRQIRKSFQEIKEEVSRNRRTPGLDRQIEDFYRGLVEDINSVLKRVSLGKDTIDKDQLIMVAQADKALIIDDENWNTGGVDLNNLKIDIRGEDIELMMSVSDISNQELGIPKDFSGLTIQIINVTPVINFQMIFYSAGK